MLGFKTTRTVVWCVDHTALCGQHLSTHTQGLKITPQPQFPTKNLTDNTTLKKSWGCAVRTTTLKPSVVLIPSNRYIIKSLIQKKDSFIIWQHWAILRTRKKGKLQSQFWFLFNLIIKMLLLFFETYSTQSIFVPQPNGLGLGIQQIILLCHKNTAVQLITT